MTPAPLLSTVLPLSLLAPFVALAGACIGSFLNVVVWRLPRQESLVFPGSHCPRCGASLAWFENLPLLSWLLLRGRCRHCQAPIAVRYPLVELLTAGLWVAMLFARPAAMGPDPSPWLLLAAGWLLASWLLPLALIDLDSLWLPEPLCRWGVWLGLALTAAVGFQQGAVVGRSLLFSHLLAVAAGLLGFEALSALAEKAMGRPALGLGDAKLAALMGAWLGPLGLGLAVSLSVLGGALIGGLARLTGRLGPQQPFPFGPFLAAGALAVWIGGHAPWLHLWGLGL
ncbi:MULTISPECIES: A24 family peptidase [unclassified Cyanobium]|uniref:prepilin peptidase n=1 Tax=unclassified Cyanobium TaxID=2627006 RepID=UPI0020CF10DE|nr:MULTISPECIES: A24 family peptidase [unclassified Cyanobium]MCP9833324.1 prepilin peptidase [Cyanobium sp. La Preciosa 7G6]MCP9935813.1 prepilin peptidase [Cyanobium sp. Aljojuca 7A6]